MMPFEERFNKEHLESYVEELDIEDYYERLKEA